MNDIVNIWVYLSASPILSIVITITGFLIATRINRLAGGSAFLHPVIVAIALIVAFLTLVETSYEQYFEGAQFIHFLLGPATVALAVPLFDHLDRVRLMFWPIIIACFSGILTAALSTIGIVLLMGGSRETVLSLTPKSVTSPIAMGIAEKIGGFPSLTAGLVLVTGAIGCVIGPVLFRLLRIRDHSVQGFTMGLAAHGFGTAQCFTISSVAGAFAGLAMGMTGMVSAFVLPVLVKVLGI
ncbi:LrgB family protein [Oceanospirillum sediminis]|uniref:LrgB family protein n=1 Tax=Oceanospirillum sediminis TaxID=2760088 RepID=A0A839IMP1_9GAMM|nr:LrgB family protein [Oceanospirillum sediminis]MBB1485980.1 LrgB family protein [Oceanospirillum sediminis]